MNLWKYVIYVVLSGIFEEISKRFQRDFGKIRVQKEINLTVLRPAISKDLTGDWTLPAFLSGRKVEPKNKLQLTWMFIGTSAKLGVQIHPQLSEAR